VYSARAKKAIDTGRFPQGIIDQLERDMDGTLPILRLFVKGSPVRADLSELIRAWIAYRSDDGLGYVSPTDPEIP
jgi:hypothetical protein